MALLYNMYTYTEQELIQLTAKGHEDAFNKLFQQYWSQVYGTCLHLTRSPEMAKDLAQEIFIKIWTQRHKLADVNNLGGYIYMLSRNMVLDYLRKKVFSPENIDFLIDYFNPKDPAPGSPHENIEYKELEAVLEKAVSRLPGRVQEVFRLSRYEGLSHAEIAKKLNISVVSSKTYIVRALQAIREYLSTHSEDVIILMALLLHHHKN